MSMIIYMYLSLALLVVTDAVYGLLFHGIVHHKSGHPSWSIVTLSEPPLLLQKTYRQTDISLRPRSPKSLITIDSSPRQVACYENVSLARLSPSPAITYPEDERSQRLVCGRWLTGANLNQTLHQIHTSNVTDLPGIDQRPT